MPDKHASLTRRNFLKNTLKLASLITLYPLIKFLSYERPIEYEEVLIKEPLKDGDFIMDDRFVLFHRNGELICVSRRCTHLGCSVNYIADKDIFRCPCHKSTFTWDGKLISGPATKDLPRLTVQLDEKNYIKVKIQK